MSDIFSVDVSVTESGRKRPEYTINTDLDGEVSLSDFLEFTKQTLIITSDEVLKEEVELGFSKDHLTFVDGSKGKPIAAVHPLGGIEFTAKADMNAIIIETYEGLLGRSPVLTGRYKESHYVFLNGTQVANSLSTLHAWLATAPDFKDKDLIRFVDIQPYARKLERQGVTAQRTQGRSSLKRRSGKKIGVYAVAPNGTYFLTSRAIRAKYKRNSSIKFSFISGSSLGIVGSFKTGRKGKPGRPYLYPTITISVSEEGTK